MSKALLQIDVFSVNKKKNTTSFWQTLVKITNCLAFKQLFYSTCFNSHFCSFALEKKNTLQCKVISEDQRTEDFPLLQLISSAKMFHHFSIKNDSVESGQLLQTDSSIIAAAQHCSNLGSTAAINVFVSYQKVFPAFCMCFFVPACVQWFPNNRRQLHHCAHEQNFNQLAALIPFFPPAAKAACFLDLILMHWEVSLHQKLAPSSTRRPGWGQFCGARRTPLRAALTRFTSRPAVGIETCRWGKEGRGGCENFLKLVYSFAFWDEVVVTGWKREAALLHFIWQELPVVYLK